MRLKTLLTVFAFLPFFAYAQDVNISTVNQGGNTSFYLQAGAFSLESDAKKRQTELQALIDKPVTVKNLSDKHLYLVEVGPIDDYQSAQTMKEQLSNTKSNQLALHKSPLAAVSQMAPNKKDNELPEGTKLWNLRNADIRAVIGEVSRVTGKNFVIDPRVQGKVSIVSSKPMSSSELYQVFLSILQVSGYAALPTGDIVKIIPNMDAKVQVSDSPHRMSKSPTGDDMMVEVVPVHYVPADQLVPVLRPLMPQWSNVSSYAPSNMLILSGRANNVKSLSEIIKKVDNSNSSDIDMFTLQHALAMDVANTLKDLVKSQPNSNRAPINISSDDRSNAIIVSGNKTDRIRLGMLILKLDRKSSRGLQANTQVIYLNYLRAEDLVPILSGIAQANFSGTVGTTIGQITRPALDSTNPASSIANNSLGSANGTASPPITQAAQNSAADATSNTTASSTQNEGNTKPTVQIIAEPNTNSIILNAPASVIHILKSVIDRLDIRPAQLLIEAVVAAVDQDDVKDLGVEWGTNKQTGDPSKFRQGFAIINSKTTSSDFQAQIYALATQNKANILSTPSVVVLDNHQAKILVGKQVSVASTTYPNNAGGTTTSGSPYTTYNRVNVALHLYVRPQITKDQGIQLQIDQGNDTIDPTSVTDANTNPTFKISSIVTSVHIESGDVVVLGGLTQDSLGNFNERIPILGDIPGIGRIFQRNTKARGKQVLMVFIKPVILRNEKNNLQMTNDKYSDVRKYQLDWIRSQEEFDQADRRAILKPMTDAELPRPFANVATNPVQTTK